MRERRVFVAGSTGATGRTAVRLAPSMGVDVVAHVRPSTAAKTQPPANAAVFELNDRPSLVEVLRGCSTVVQLIGTMRKRFASGDTYESSDIGTTRLLVDAALEAGCDHVVLLSSVGAGRPVGAYLKAKAAAEAIVRDSGIAWTIVRPSAFEGEGHTLPPGMRLLTGLLHLDTYRPIRVEELASAILYAAKQRSPIGMVLEGRTLWDVVEQAQK